MSDGHMLVNFGAVEQASSDVDAVANQITAQLADLRAYLAPLVSSWEGNASQDWQALQHRWDTTATDLNGVLSQMAVALRTAASNYSGAERANASIWG